MKDNDIYDYNSKLPNPNEDFPIDILNYVPIYFINNTYDNIWRVIAITELIITLPYDIATP